MVQESWLVVVEVVKERVLRLSISQGGRQDDQEDGEKDYHPGRRQVEHTLTGGWEAQPLYQAGSCRCAPGFQTCTPLPVSFVILLLFHQSFRLIIDKKAFLISSSSIYCVFACIQSYLIKVLPLILV